MMMKVLRAFALLLILPVLCFGARTKGNCVYDGDFTFTFDLTTKKGSLIKYTGTDSEVTVPSSFIAEEQYKDDGGEWKTRHHTITVTCIGANYGYAPSESNRPFYNNTTLRRINIPETVRTIGIYAFENCLSLESIKTPSSLSSLGDSAFMGCSSLKEVEINGDGTVVISHDTFSGCTALEKCAFEGVCKIVGSTSSMFCDSVNLREVRFGSGIRTIPSTIFDRRANLQTVTFSSVTNIEGNAFAECTNLVSISSVSDVRTFGYRAFYGCSALTSVDLSSAEQIGAFAFDGCNGLDSVSTSTSLSRLGSLAFRNCKKLSTVVIDGNGQLSLGRQVFIGCTNLEMVVLGEGLAEIEEGSTLVAGASVGMFYGCSRLKSVDIRTTKLNKLPNYMFYGTPIEQVSIAGGIKDVGNSAFYGCGELTLVTGNFNYVTNIGDCAFTDCSALTTIPSTDGLRIVGNNAFQNCSSLAGLLSLENLESIGSCAFQNCSGVVGDLILPKVVAINTLAFAGCNNLTKVITDKSLSTLGRQAFSRCSELKYAEINGNGNATVSVKAFEYCPNLEELVLGDGIRTLAKWNADGLWGCSKLWKVSFGELIDTIPPGYFSGLPQLQMVTCPSVTNVAKGAFLNCTNLMEISLLPVVETIGEDAFRNCRSLGGTIDLPQIEIIGASAFYGCNAIEGGKFGESLTSIGSAAFYNCTNASSFAFASSPPAARDDTFSNVKSGAVGIYSAKYKEEWEEVIEPNGTWKRLIMVANKPVLSNDGCDVAAGELTIRWDDDDAPMPPGMTYEVHRGFSDDYAASEVLTNGYSRLSFVDKDFYTTGGVSRVWYWVKPEHELFEPSDPLVTRTRYGIFVGFSQYDRKRWRKLKGKKGFYNDAHDFRTTLVENGGFSSENARFIFNDMATINTLRQIMREQAERLLPGDISVFFIATHGGGYITKVFSLDGDDGSVVKESGLAVYDGIYTVRSLLEDVRKFPSGAAVLNIIKSCHSYELTGGVDPRNSVNEWLIDCGFGQCLGNVAWITDCDVRQSSYTVPNESHSRFGIPFIMDGLVGGYADVRLHGTEYVGVEPDGKITFGELGRYAREFYKGISDDDPSDVQLENTPLLDRIVVGLHNSVPIEEPPGKPEDVTVVSRDMYTLISWSGADTSSSYWIYRYPVDNPSEWRWIGTSFTTNYEDKTAKLNKKYGYRVMALNPIGKSELSHAVEGSRGTMSYLEYFGRYFDISWATSDDWNTMEKTFGANGHTYGECYMLGIDPEDPEDDFRITHFEMQDGEPHITLNHTKDGSGNSFEDRIKIIGKANLADEEWVDVVEMPKMDGAPLRFFKVKVELP